MTSQPVPCDAPCSLPGCETIWVHTCPCCGDPVCEEHTHRETPGTYQDGWMCTACAEASRVEAEKAHLEWQEELAQKKIPARAWARAIRAVHQGKVLVITGAGVSAESGIPTFRSVDGSGIYESADWNPVEFLRSTTVDHQIDKLWEYYLERFAKTMEGKEPNSAHLAIAYLEDFMRDTDGEFLLVTQNIDGLHLEAGNSRKRTVELHGTRQMRCSGECWIRNNGGVAKLADIPANAEFPDDLTCPDCGYIMRPHVLLFDEVYSQELYRSTEAHDFASEADLVITVGCSAVVPVAHILANYAVVNDAVVIDVNPSAEGPLGELAEQQGVRLQGRAGMVMPQLVDFLTG